MSADVNGSEIPSVEATSSSLSHVDACCARLAAVST